MFNKILVFFNNTLFKLSGLLSDVDKTIHGDWYWEEGPGAGMVFMRDFLRGLDTMLIPFGFFMCTVLTIYAIVLGVNYAKSENPKDEKKKIIGTISSLIFIVIVVMLLKFIIIPNMGSIYAFIEQTFSF